MNASERNMMERFARAGALAGSANASLEQAAMLLEQFEQAFNGSRMEELERLAGEVAGVKDSIKAEAGKARQRADEINSAARKEISGMEVLDGCEALVYAMGAMKNASDCYARLEKEFADVIPGNIEFEQLGGSIAGIGKAFDAAMDVFDRLANGKRSYRSIIADERLVAGEEGGCVELAFPEAGGKLRGCSVRINKKFCRRSDAGLVINYYPGAHYTARDVSTGNAFRISEIDLKEAVAWANTYMYATQPARGQRRGRRVRLQ